MKCVYDDRINENAVKERRCGMTEQNVISPEELSELLERYNIGKKPLAALLGWGATAVMRYADGVSPVREYGVSLKRLYEEPLYYLELLEERKEYLTPVAYKKSKNAVLLYLSSSKLWCALQYLMKKADRDLSPYRGVMTLYYAQAFSLALNGEALFSEECTLSSSGEIPYKEAYERLKAEGTRYDYYGEGMLSPGEEEYLEAAYEMLLWYGPAELKLIFAAERRYIRAGRTPSGEKKIKNSSIGGYFKKVVQGYKITRPEEFNLYFAERTGRGRKR